MLKIIRYRDSNDEHRWRIKSANGKILADSGEGYKTAQGRDHSLSVLLEELRSGNPVQEEKGGAALTHPCS